MDVVFRLEFGDRFSMREEVHGVSMTCSVGFWNVALETTVMTHGRAYRPSIL